MRIDKQLLETVDRMVLGHLKAYPEGIKEHSLLKLLVDEGDNSESVFSERYESSHDLFKAHFFLFHVLYRLRLSLFQAGTHWLEISALNIQLKPLSTQVNSVNHSGNEVAEADPLAAYYLDLSHLEKTTEAEVEAMLNRFYQGLSGGLNPRGEALATLGLADPVDDRTIKTQYRKLAMKHHPDRGGSEDKLKEIHLAVNVLLG